MLALIGGIETNIKVTSHILEADHDAPLMFHLFHCWKCGNSLFQFRGDCVMSLPGDTEIKGKVFVPLIHMCRKCKHRHLVNSIL